MLLRELKDGELKRILDAQNGPTIEDGLASTVRIGNELSRKQAFSARLCVEQETHIDLLRSYAARFYNEPDIRGEILQHVDVTRNLQRQVTNAVAIAYNVPPRRTLRGVDEDQQRAFHRAYRRARWDSIAEQVNRLAFVCNVVHVLPRLYRGCIHIELVLPHAADVVIPDGESEPAILVYACGRKDTPFVAVDAERYQWLDKDYRVVADEPHELGMVPWVAFRWEHAPRSDWWNRGAGQALYDGTMKVGRIGAQLAWVRQHSSKKLAHFHVGENVDVPANQNASATSPIHTRGDGAAKIEVHDTIVQPDAFLAEISEVTETVLELYGLPTNVVDFSRESNRDAANGNVAANVRNHDALAKVRAKQVKQFELAEAELAVRMAALLRQSDLTFTLSDDDVRDVFRVTFTTLSYADTPKAKHEAAKLAIELGQTNVFELYQSEHPGTTEDEAREAVQHNLDVHAEHVRLLVARGVAIDPAKVVHPGLLDPKDAPKTPAQVYGMIGGKESGVVRAGESADSPDGVTQ